MDTAEINHWVEQLKRRGLGFSCLNQIRIRLLKIIKELKKDNSQDQQISLLVEEIILEARAFKSYTGRELAFSKIIHIFISDREDRRLLFDIFKEYKIY